MTMPKTDDVTVEHLWCDRIELRAARPGTPGPGMLVGYVVKWNTLSSPLIDKRSGQGFRETFRPAAFRTFLQDDPATRGDVFAVTEHEEGARTTFGSYEAGTLRLVEDSIGLRFENDLADTSDGRDLAVKVARRDVRGVSPGFIPNRDGVGWEDTRSELPTRVISQAKLRHLSYEPRPAYRDTSVALRSLEEARAETVDIPAADDRVMVALFPARDVAARLAVEGGEAAEDLHLTLAYLGRAIEVGTTNIDKAAMVCGLLASWGWPLPGSIGGVGRFAATPTSDDKDVAVALVDVPALAELRQRLVDALQLEGVAISRTHGFIPHITLAYLDPAEPPPLARIEPFSLNFAALSLVVEGSRRDFPLAPGAALRSETQEPPPATPEIPKPSHPSALALARLRLAEAGL